MSQRSAPAVIGPDLRSALVAMVRKRVPESEVEDIVQATLAEALESPNAPKESDALRRWLFGVAKHKIVDHHRRAGRVSFDLPEVSEGPAPHAEADLLRWAERHLPPGDDAKKTLGWMLREGDGEKLEAIAESERVPAPRVRQRVSRLRRHLKQHWAREVAVLAALGVVVTALLLLLREPEPEPIAHDPRAVPAPVDPRAEPLRKAALEHCAASEWEPCLEGLDEAKRLDPAGDARPEVQRARAAAKRALTPPPAPSPSPSPAPTPTPAPAPTLAPKPTPKPTPTLAPKPTKAIPIPTSAPSASAPLTREELLRRKELLGRKNAPTRKKVVPRKAPATK